MKTSLSKCSSAKSLPMIDSRNSLSSSSSTSSSFSTFSSSPSTRPAEVLASVSESPWTSSQVKKVLSQDLELSEAPLPSLDEAGNDDASLVALPPEEEDDEIKEEDSGAMLKGTPTRQSISSSFKASSRHRLVEYFIVVSAKKGMREKAMPKTKPKTRRKKKKGGKKDFPPSPPPTPPPPPHPPSPPHSPLSPTVGLSTRGSSFSSTEDDGLDSSCNGREGGKGQRRGLHDTSPLADILDTPFHPTITARYPPEDHVDNPLNRMVTHFCHPTSSTSSASDGNIAGALGNCGSVDEVLTARMDYAMPKIHHFVLTGSDGRKMYGTCLTIWEPNELETRTIYDNNNADDEDNSKYRDEGSENRSVPMTPDRESTGEDGIGDLSPTSSNGGKWRRRFRVKSRSPLRRRRKGGRMSTSDVWGKMHGLGRGRKKPITAVERPKPSPQAFTNDHDGTYMDERSGDDSRGGQVEEEMIIQYEELPSTSMGLPFMSPRIEVTMSTTSSFSGAATPTSSPARVLDGRTESPLTSSSSPPSSEMSSVNEEDDDTVNDVQDGVTRCYYLPRCLCILSCWPYLTAFREYLTQLYRLYFSTSDVMVAPLERYIVNLCSEIAAPPPGVFEVRCRIFDSTVRFWSPPGNQPVAWVALPFGNLFSCLRGGSVLKVWHALTLERQVLLVSSQLSLLTVCAEILVSLLFPMAWTNLYIPLVPRFLTPMLGAPMPYLCGLSKDDYILAASNGDISPECIVVNLDEDKVTMGESTPAMPDLPTRRAAKLLKVMELNAGQVYREARGLGSHPFEAQLTVGAGSGADSVTQPVTTHSTGVIQFTPRAMKAMKTALPMSTLPNATSLLNAKTPTATSTALTLRTNRSGGNGGDNGGVNGAERAPNATKDVNALSSSSVTRGDGGRVWAERLKNFDEAFNLAFTPDSPNLLNESGSAGSETGVQSAWDAIQEAFLRFYVSVLRDYRKFISLATPTEGRGSDGGASKGFRTEEFVTAARLEYQPFLAELCATQQFDAFLTKRLYEAGDADVTFFDQSIDAKLNRSRLKLRKVDTPFLQAASAHKKLKSIIAVEPSTDDLPSDWRERQQSRAAGIGYGVGGRNPVTKATVSLSYPKWPETLDSSLFNRPRPLPQFIVVEYERREKMSQRIRGMESSHLNVSDRSLLLGECDPSPEVGTFTIFFLAYTAVIGTELVELIDKTSDAEARQAASPLHGAELDCYGKDVGDVVHERGNRRIVGNSGGVDRSGYQHLGEEIVGTNGADRICLRQTANSSSSLSSGLCGTPSERRTRLHPRTTISSISTENQRSEMYISPQHSRNCGSLRLEEAREIAGAQIDLAMNVLQVMKVRKLVPDLVAYKSLIEACGRCGDATRAMQLVVSADDAGLSSDGVIHSCLMEAFSVQTTSAAKKPDIDDAAREKEEGAGKKYDNGGVGGPIDWQKLRKKTAKAAAGLKQSGKSKARVQYSFGPDFLIDDMTARATRRKEENSDHKSFEGVLVPSPTNLSNKSSSTQSTMGNTFISDLCTVASFLVENNRAHKYKKTYRSSLVTNPVLKQVKLGEDLLQFLYPELFIDTQSETCPQCFCTVSEDDIVQGWRSCDSRDYNTTCPNCTRRFVACFTVRTTSPNFVGSRGKCTPLKCEFVSPWVLRKELRRLAADEEHGGIRQLLDPGFRTGVEAAAANDRDADVNATLWWNIIVSFARYRIPISFLLQGSFHNRLIAPTPDT